MRKESDITAAPDAELVKRTAKGDEACFREVLSRHQGVVYGYARRMLGEDAMAEDVAQEVFLRFYRNAHKFRYAGNLRGYLLRISRNLCIDHLRKREVRLVDSAQEPVTHETPLAKLESKRAVEAMDSALAGLPANQRSAVVLRHGQGLSYAEIASVMETSVSAVESLLVRARRTLRDSMSAHHSC